MLARRLTPCAQKCDGASKTCPINAFRSQGTVCRAAAGVCDVDDVCTGSSASCAQVFKSGDVCRPASGVCDAEEKCNGAIADCPSDLKRGSATQCRAAVGTCDRAEMCDGSSNDCPADAFFNANVVCRASRGACDVDEVPPPAARLALRLSAHASVGAEMLWQQRRVSDRRLPQQGPSVRRVVWLL